ncbi:MAG TPA: methyltransferase [Deltaproteobacteria bacterium]|nr:methyltransferase [Deltaproteobacteria bacterium]HXK46281.1 methyltransferase [Deltaproteobacteria bacterium]
MTDRFKPGDDETLDRLSCGELSIFQKKKGYRYSLDAYLLGAFVEEAPGTGVIEIGSGSGVVSILLASMKGLTMTGVEIQEDLAEMSRRSVELAGLQNMVTITCCDISGYRGPRVDAVVTNPPYRPLKTGRINPAEQKAIARHEISLDLDTLLKVSHDLLKPNGRFYIVYPTWRLPDLLCSMRANRIEPKRMRCAYTAMDRSSEICLICGTRGGGRELVVESPLIIFSEDGAYHNTMGTVFQGLSFTKKALT